MLYLSCDVFFVNQQDIHQNFSWKHWCKLKFVTSFCPPHSPVSETCPVPSVDPTLEVCRASAVSSHVKLIWKRTQEVAYILFFDYWSWTWRKLVQFAVIIKFHFILGGCHPNTQYSTFCLRKHFSFIYTLNIWTCQSSMLFWVCALVNLTLIKVD